MISKRDIIVNFPETISEAKRLMRYIDPDRESCARPLSNGGIDEQRKDLVDVFAKELLKFLEEDNEY